MISGNENNKGNVNEAERIPTYQESRVNKIFA